MGALTEVGGKGHHFISGGPARGDGRLVHGGRGAPGAGLGHEGAGGGGTRGPTVHVQRSTYTGGSSRQKRIGENRGAGARLNNDGPVALLSVGRRGKGGSREEAGSSWGGRWKPREEGITSGSSGGKQRWGAGTTAPAEKQVRRK